ncbi:hypothetical protein AB0C38_10000 [Amycolatopsis sp. NPDC048633]|uniref:hypothetical protein n=1 Tax=Amycolatopsis sp. NPDC048633 TaxID=3157095 RepID=UPI003402B127
MSNDDSSAELRGNAARQMLEEDARWAMDVVLSGRETGGDNAAYFPLLLGHHFVRIAYEGAIALRSPRPHVGIPELAALLNEQYAAITARARHATKLLDDTQKSDDDVLSELEKILEDHHNRLTGNTFRWTRWLQSDIGLFLHQDRLIGATAPTAYRLGLDITNVSTISGEDLRAVSEEWGATMAVLGVAALNTSRPTATIDLSGGFEINYRDRRVSRYFRRRFESKFPNSLKTLLLLIEGDLNTARTVLPRTTVNHEQAGFRARTITLYHSLTTLKRVLARYPDTNTEGMRGIQILLGDSPTLRLLSSEGRQVRNRCMHYEMSDPTLHLDLSLPMFGIIEAVYPGNNWDQFDRDVTSVTSRVADLLGCWKSTGR